MAKLARIIKHPLFVRVIATLAVTAAAALFGMEINEERALPLVEMAVSCVAAWLVLRRPGDADKAELDHAKAELAEVKRRLMEQMTGTFRHPEED